MGGIANRYFIFGFGSAFIILPLLFYLIYSTEYKKTVATYSSGKNISDEEIVERAEKMGMVFLKSLPSDGEMTEEEMLDRLSKEAIISRGMELGLVPATELVPSGEAEAIWKNIDAPDDPGTVGTDTSGTEGNGIEGNVNLGNGMEIGSTNTDEAQVIRVDIPVGVSSTTIGEILERAGVVNDADRLVSYFNEKEMSRQLLQGSYEFREGESFEQILKMLSTRDEINQ